jgi:serine/threonine-protein kinase Chk2
MADTQPMEEALASQGEGPPGEPWGWLVTVRRHLAPVLTPLAEDKVGVGREGQQFLIDPKLFEDSSEEIVFGRVSRAHFEVFRDHGFASLVDKSTNGTFVNELRVGKDQRCRLGHGDTIGLLQPDFAVYSFLHEAHIKLHFPEELGSRYLVGRTLGTGANAVVKEAFTRVGHVRRAVKIICKDESSETVEHKDLMHEVEVVKGLRHPCITEIVEVFDTEEAVMIVMECAAGGELFDQVVKDMELGRLEERHAKIQFYQAAHAVAFLHSRRVCHRDLKMENILLDTVGPTARIKVTDFGLSKRWSSTSKLETFVGTPSYMAPEVIVGYGGESLPYDCKSDCWSLGVLLYILLTGHQPFRRGSGSLGDLRRAVTAGRYEPMTGRAWAAVSGEAKELVGRLLRVEPGERPAAAAILEHEWFRGDRATVASAWQVMGLLVGEVEGDSGRGSSREEEMGVMRAGDVASSPAAPAGKKRKRSICEMM